MDLFKKIAFTSGTPLIVVDLMIYLCGGYNNKSISEKCREAVNLLSDRVPPVRVPRRKGSILNRQIT